MTAPIAPRCRRSRRVRALSRLEVRVDGMSCSWVAGGRDSERGAAALR
jgi:hypothetical protein